MWTFGAPYMLGWLAAAVIPLVLLWWHRPRRLPLRFAAMQFVKRAIAREGRTRAWLQWWLVALQMLALVLLALGWSNLQWLREQSARGERTWHVLLIDGTASMSAGDSSAGETHFERAVEAARQVVRTSPPADIYSLIVVRQNCDKVIGEPIENASGVLQELDRLQVTAEAGNFATALQQLQAIVESSESTLPTKQLLVHGFSDFQASTWPITDGANVQEAWQQLQTSAPAFNIRWQRHDVGSLPAEQLSQRDLIGDAPWLFVGQGVSIQGSIENEGNQPQDVRIAWSVDDQLAAEQSERIPGGTSKNFNRRLTFTSPAEHVVKVALDGNVLPFAAERYLIVPVRKQVRVLAVGNSKEDTRSAALALAPERTLPQPPVHVDERTDLNILAGNLQPYDLILLANLPALTADQAARLGEFLHSGGGVVVLLGETSQPADWSQISWLPADVSELQPPKLVTFDPGTYDHPLLSVFRSATGGGSLEVPCWQHFPLRPRANSLIALSFSDGSPAVVTNQQTAGRVVLWSLPWSSRAQVELADGASAPWSALDQWPSFVPLAQETMRYAVAGRAGANSATVGDRLQGRLPRDGAAANFKIVRPDGRQDQLAVQAVGNVWSWSYDAANLPGIYEVRGSEEALLQRIAVNVPRAESNRARRENLFEDAEQMASPSGLEQLALAFPWNRLFLGLAFVMLISETLLNWQLGRRVR